MAPGQNNSPIISITPREASLRRKVRRHLHSLGFHKSADGTLNIGGHDKDLVRRLHGPQRTERLAVNSDFLSRRARQLLPYFASGRDLDPPAIRPRLERVYAGTWQADLFRLATLTWSVPVSNGFGRRLRYVIWDAHNNKLLGVLAIGDPVFNLSVRDGFIGWGADERRERLVNVMDAYVLGALPPYNSLLGGKMVACLLRRSFKNKFEHSLLDRHIGAQLLRYLIDGELAEFSPSRLASSTALLCSDLQRQSAGGTRFDMDAPLETAGVTVTAPILATTNDSRRFVIALSDPLTPRHAADASIAALDSSQELPVIVENELIVRGNLPAATRRIMAALR